MAIFRNANYPTGSSYYWEWCKRFGNECYRTWRAELSTAFVVTVVACLITWRERTAWDSILVALEANLIVFAIFVMGHLFRVPFLLHNERNYPPAGGIRYVAPSFGVLGAVILLGITVGIVYRSAKPFAFQLPNITIKAPVQPLPLPERVVPSVPGDQCWVHSYVAPRDKDLSADVVSASQTIIFCNRKYDVPFSITIEYDENISRAGAIVFPLGGMSSMDEIFKDGAISAVVRAPIIRPYEPFLVFAYGATDKPPMVKNLTIKTASTKQHFKP
jgi:hypothetical protein